MSESDDPAHTGRFRITAIVVCSSVAVVSAAIRFWCKIARRTGIHADDWWLLAAVITGLGAEGVLLWGNVLMMTGSIFYSNMAIRCFRRKQ
jgi:hypothetical protein